MATRAENIETRLDAIAAELAAMSASMAGGLPNNSEAGNIDHVGYRMSLLNEMAALRQELAAAEGAWEETSEMVA